MFRELLFYEEVPSRSFPNQAPYHVFEANRFGHTRSSSKLLDLSLQVQLLEQRVKKLEDRDV